MALRFHKWHMKLALEGSVEAESKDEAVRIVEGIVENVTAVLVLEGAVCEVDADDLLRSDKVEISDVEVD